MAGDAADLQPAARDLFAARDALAAGQVSSARAALQRAAVPLVARAQRGRMDGHAVPRDAARLAGAAATGQAERAARRTPGAGIPGGGGSK
jgi:hypothetical protein